MLVETVWRRRRLVLGALVTLLALATNLAYFFFGYSPAILFGWLASITGGTAVFFMVPEGKRVPYLDKADAIVLGVLALAFAPVFLVGVRDIPLQMSTDEIAIMSFARAYADPGEDLFGLSGYFRFPSLVFIVLGLMGEALGGVTLGNMRLIHGMFGLLTVLASYLFFRTFLRKDQAAAIAVLVGTSHVLIIISRMAMRNNISLFVSLAFLALFALGVQRRSYVLMFLGGLCAGLEAYLYFPGRISVFAWILAYVGLMLALGQWKERAKLGGAALAGMLLVAAPLGVSMLKEPAQSNAYYLDQSLLTEEGRRQQMEWISASSQTEAVVSNIRNGMLMFNNRMHDLGFTYPNFGHGFVDPLSGLLVWAGVALLLLRRDKREEETIVLAMFLVILILFSFVITKAPDYSRSLILIPFVAYLVFVPIDALARAASAGSGRTLAYGAVVIGFVGLIALSNFAIIDHFNRDVNHYGSITGTTSRYVEDRKGWEGYQYVIVSDTDQMYYSWGDAGMWRGWVEYFTSPSQTAIVIPPNESFIDKLHPPFTVFMTRPLWEANRQAFEQSYPRYVVHEMKQDGSKVALEVT